MNSINIGDNVNVVNMTAGQRKVPVRRESYHHGDLKRALTDAALSLVAEKGPKGFSLTEAARRAGVSAAAPYRHFADKAELLAAVSEQGFAELDEALGAAGRATSDPRERVVELGRAYVRWAVTHPDHYRVMFGAEVAKGDHPTLAVAARGSFDNLWDAIAECQEAGIAVGREARDVAGPLWSLVHGVASLAIGSELRVVGITADPEVLVAESISVLLG